MTANNASQGRTTSRDSLWLYVVKKKDKHILYPLYFQGCQTGATLLYNFNHSYEAVKLTTHWWHTPPQLEDATISPFCIGDPEAQDYPREAIIHERTPPPDLTSAFINSSILRGAGAELIRQHSRFNFTPATVGTDPCHAILISTKANRGLIGVAVAGAILFSMAVGVAVGFAFRSADIGFAAAGLVIAVLAFIQACLVTV